MKRQLRKLSRRGRQNKMIAEMGYDEMRQIILTGGSVLVTGEVLTTAEGNNTFSYRVEGDYRELYATLNPRLYKEIIELAKNQRNTREEA